MIMSEKENIFKSSRVNAKKTQAEAAEALNVSEDKISNYETGKTEPKPSDVKLLADFYKDPYLCNKYCANVCEIGRGDMPQVELKELPHLTVSILASLNTISSETNRLLEIAEDGTVSSDELTDFNSIMKKLDKIEMAVTALKLWAKKNTLN